MATKLDEEKGVVMRVYIRISTDDASGEYELAFTPQQLGALLVTPGVDLDATYLTTWLRQFVRSVT